MRGTTEVAENVTVIVTGNVLSVRCFLATNSSDL